MRTQSDLEKAKERVIHESPVHGPVILAEIERLTSPRDACGATPCDVIAGINADRDRTVDILMRMLPAVEAARVIDAIHGKPL